MDVAEMRRVFQVPLALLAAIGLFAWLRDPAPMPTGPTIGAHEPRYVLRGAQWRSYDAQGALRFEGSASLIDFFDDESARMQDFEIRVPGRQDQPWVARAPAGEVPPGGGERLRLTGGVEGHGAWPDGQTLKFSTESLWVDPGSRSLETDTPVSVKSPGREGRASGMQVDGVAQRVNLLGEVEIRYVAR